MKDVPASQEFPAARWIVVIVAVGAMVAAVLWRLDGLIDSDPVSGRKAVLAGAIVTTAASAFGLVPVVMVRRLGEGWRDFGWMAAMPFRFVLTLTGLAALVKLVDVPATPAVISTIVTYLVLLTVETCLMYRFVQVKVTTSAIEVMTAEKERTDS